MSINLVTSTVIKDNGVTFATSGTRGLVTQFTANECTAFIAAINSNFTFSKVALAIDNRPSSYTMAQVCA
ncbi:hypothetical protein [Vibrio sp. DW001]|uniref:hypothetical protein n=1 Tax=Vibrio sp. DW001 TaxID=2912315 RepID=UPI0031841838